MCILKKHVLKRVHVSKRDVNKSCVERTKPFLLLFKLGGLFPNNIMGNRVECCSWSTYSICVFWIGIFFSYVCYVIFVYATSPEFTLRRTMYTIKYCITYSSVSIDVITAYLSQKHFNKFFNRLQNYDDKAAQIIDKRSDSLWIPWIIAFLVTLVSLLIMVIHIYRLYKMDDLSLFTLITSYYFMNHFPIIVQMYSFLEKFILLYLLLERFKRLNEDIVSNVSWDEDRYRFNVIKISDVKFMHLMLYQGHEAFNDIYRNTLLVSFMSLMMCIVANLYLFREKDTLIGTSLVGPPLMLMLFMCTICHLTMEKANNIAFMLNKSMTTLVNSGKTLTKISVSTFFLHNYVSFDAAGFFTIDLPLFQSVIASIITYFIIIV
ncbi:hypothetical protein PUN28_011866 [Cardiocondyla obscurior]|uniref:Gustatory receptor n=1 Tax=Cardiocondyla obscurior TaxID=286306 RepID=A0AAW2FJ90_9HYME